MQDPGAGVLYISYEYQYNIFLGNFFNKIEKLGKQSGKPQFLSLVCKTTKLCNI